MRGLDRLSNRLGAVGAGLYGIEFDRDANQDVASQGDVQESWDEHGQLPGFAVGS